MSFWQLFVAGLRSLVRNRMALFWFLVFPVIFILIFGAVFSGDQSPSFQIGLAYPAGDPLGEGIRAGLGEVKSLHVHAGDLEAELRALKKGDRGVVIEIPKDAARSVGSGTRIPVPVYYDKSHEQTGHMLFAIVNEAFAEAERRITDRPRLFEPRLEPFQTTPLRSIDFLVPGILAMALMQLGFFGSFQMVSLREQKVLKALGATPLPRLYVIGAEVLVRLVLSVVQFVLCISLGIAVFGLHVTGNWLAVLGVVMLGALVFTSLGYLLTCRARNVDSGQGLVQLVQFPMMFLSGIFFPVAIMPSFLHPVAAAMPLTYLGDALRQVMVGMPAQFPLAGCTLVLAAWLAGSMTLAVLLWRWE
jgi:ABC-2 type transport system permease protein